MKADIVLQCLRCRQPFIIEPTLTNLTDFCSTCRLKLGMRMSPERIAHLNAGCRTMSDRYGLDGTGLPITPFSGVGEGGSFSFGGRRFSAKVVK